MDGNMAVTRATALLGPAQDDPALVAVERMRGAEVRLNMADEAIGIRDWVREQRGHGSLPDEFGPVAELDREIQEALRDYRTAWEELLETRPTTLLGFAAKAFYLTEYEEDDIGRTLRSDVVALLGVRDPQVTLRHGRRATADQMKDQGQHEQDDEDG